ncbi:MAG: hypothetical protein M1814_000534 [Vezdaea aestivalis]|nr:MAG: hypothetical protein M1814_000534 [Vezdaea aestivalis]
MSVAMMQHSTPQNSTTKPVEDGQVSGVIKGQNFPDIPKILPHEKVFPIQIGSKLFRLSGASISSDAPSYFSQFFIKEMKQKETTVGVRTLYIDRDPTTFQDISRHLQGYHVHPRDSGHFVKLFADAQFYGLPRLISMLFESEIFIEIGHRPFQIPRDIFSSPGDSPNYFSLGFAEFFSSPSEAFPGLEKQGLLRPPPIAPPAVPARSADVFAELLYMLRGYPLRIRSEEHRESLLRDCRYFHLRGLEQKLIRHSIAYNPKRSRSEITLRLEDVRQSGVEFVVDPALAEFTPGSGWVQYARPFVDEISHLLILEIGAEGTTIDLRTMRANFVGQTKARIASLFQVVANKMNMPVTQPLGLLMMSGGASSQPPSPANTPLSEDLVRVRIEKETYISLDGEQLIWSDPSAQEDHDYEDLSTPNGSSNPNFFIGTAGDLRPNTPSARSIAESSPGAGVVSNHTPVMGFPRIDGGGPPPRKRRRQDSVEEHSEWVVKKGQWRLRVQNSPSTKAGFEIILMAVTLEAYSGELGRNSRRTFLG